MRSGAIGQDRGFIKQESGVHQQVVLLESEVVLLHRKGIPNGSRIINERKINYMGKSINQGSVAGV